MQKKKKVFHIYSTIAHLKIKVFPTQRKKYFKTKAILVTSLAPCVK